jgi:hypothetical protein
MTLPADDRDILDRISAQLAAEEPHLTGMYRVFSRLTVRDLIPDEDAVRSLPRRLASAGGSGRPPAGGPDAAGPGAGGLRLRGRTVLTGRQARIMAVPALLLAILITVIAFTAGSGMRCTRAMALHGAPGVAGASCRNGAAAPPPTNR